MKRFMFAEAALKSSSEMTRDRFAGMTHSNRVDRYRASSVLAGIEGWNKASTKM